MDVCSIMENIRRNFRLRGRFRLRACFLAILLTFSLPHGDAGIDVTSDRSPACMYSVLACPCIIPAPVVACYKSDGRDVLCKFSYSVARGLSLSPPFWRMLSCGQVRDITSRLSLIFAAREDSILLFKSLPFLISSLERKRYMICRPSNAEE